MPPQKTRTPAAKVSSKAEVSEEKPVAARTKAAGTRTAGAKSAGAKAAGAKTANAKAGGAKTRSPAAAKKAAPSPRKAGETEDKAAAARGKAPRAEKPAAAGKKAASADKRAAATAEKRAPAPRRSVVADLQPGHTYSKRGEATFERVMRIVAAMYRERGYERTSMSALARRAGVTAPAIYHYFGSKEEILAAFLDYTLRDLAATVKAAIRGKTWTAKLQSFMKALVRWQLQQTPFPEAYDRIFELGQLRNSLPDEHRNNLLKLEREFYEVCRGMLEAGMAAGEFRTLPVQPTTFAIIAMGDYILGWYRPDGPLTQSQLADLYADLVVAMVRAPQEK